MKPLKLSVAEVLKLSKNCSQTFRRFIYETDILKELKSGFSAFKAQRKDEEQKTREYRQVVLEEFELQRKFEFECIDANAK